MLEDSVSPKKYEGNWADPVHQGQGRQGLSPTTAEGWGIPRTVL